MMDFIRSGGAKEWIILYIHGLMIDWSMDKS